jgi:DGQHR domain-containing protein
MTSMTEPTESATTKPQRPQFGRVALPAIGYFQGSRRMVTTVMSPVTLVDQAGPREAWDPLHGTGTNRKEDKAHRKGIADYVETREDYVIGSILAYLDPSDAEFVADDPSAEISIGTLYYRPGAKIVIGDGGHRTSAFGDVVDAHRELNGEVFKRMMRNGQPLIIVLDGDRTNRARDFVTLQNNAKPLNQSVAQSMNIDEALNKALLERVIKDGTVPVFEGGKRVEFLTDSPGKLSAKIASYKAIRYTSGTLLVGTGHRSAKSWTENVDLAMARAETHEDDPVGHLIEFWQGYGRLPAVTNALLTDRGVALLRADTWLASANLLYALAAAVHQVVKESPLSITEAFEVLGKFDFSRSGTGLHGTLVEPPVAPPEGNGRPSSRTGRDAWEGAGQVLADFVFEQVRPAA